MFCQNFTVGVPGLGEVLTVPLVEGGEELMVTEDNRREYVEMYIDHYLNTSVHSQVIPRTGTAPNTVISRRYDRGLDPRHGSKGQLKT